MAKFKFIFEVVIGCQKVNVLLDPEAPPKTFAMTPAMFAGKVSSFVLDGVEHLICKTYDPTRPYAEFILDRSGFNQWEFIRSMRTVPCYHGHEDWNDCPVCSH